MKNEKKINAVIDRFSVSEVDNINCCGFPDDEIAQINCRAEHDIYSSTGAREGAGGTLHSSTNSQFVVRQYCRSPLAKLAPDNLVADSRHDIRLISGGHKLFSYFMWRC